MVSYLTNYNETTKNHDSIRYSHPMFSHYAVNAYANLLTDNKAATQEDFKVTRSFVPKKYIKGDKNNRELAFAVKIAQLYDSVKAEKFIRRSNDAEIINYRGNIIDYGRDSQFGAKFFALDVLDVFTENFDPGLVRDKIVLMGFLGANFQDTSWEDKFYTPMNPVYAGKANPDMYGLVIHANIIAMILDGEFVNSLPVWLEIVMGILLTFFNIVFFSVIYRRLSKWYDGFTKLLQLIELLILLFLIIMVFHWFSLKLNLTLGFAGIALAGDGLEVFYGVIMNLFSREGRTQVFKVDETS
jgi:CHASE2 domain-containing sensor protein